MEAKTAETTGSRYIVETGSREIIDALVVGAITGILVWALAWVFDHGVFTPLMCKAASSAKCAQSGEFALVTSQIVSAIIALVALVRMRAFRPLLVVLFVTVALWNVTNLFAAWPMWAMLVGAAVVYLLAYGLFTLLARMRSLVFTAILMVVCLLAIRLVVAA